MRGEAVAAPFAIFIAEEIALPAAFSAIGRPPALPRGASAGGFGTMPDLDAAAKLFDEVGGSAAMVHTTETPEAEASSCNARRGPVGGADTGTVAAAAGLAPVGLVPGLGLMNAGLVAAGLVAAGGDTLLFVALLLVALLLGADAGSDPMNSGPAVGRARAKDGAQERQTGERQETPWWDREKAFEASSSPSGPSLASLMTAEPSAVTWICTKMAGMSGTAPPPGQPPTGSLNSAENKSKQHRMSTWS